MTKLLDQAVEVVRQLAPDAQDAIAHAMINLARTDDSEPEPIDPAHMPAVREGLAQARRREFSPVDIEACFRPEKATS